MAPRKVAASAATRSKTGATAAASSKAADAKKAANTSAAAKPAGVTKKKSPAPPTRTSTRTSAKAKTAATKETAAATTATKATKATKTTKITKTKTVTKAKAEEAPVSRKRKAVSEEEEEVEAKPKKARVIKSKTPDVKKAKAARVTASPAPKALKPKVIINEGPTEKLNVYVFGEGSSGELGLGAAKNAVDVKRPRLNAFLNADTVGVVLVATGGMHCVALTHDNKILTWGVNDQGALGRDTTWEGKLKDIDAGSDDDSDDESDSGMNPKEATPTAIPTESFPEGTVFVQVAAGDSSSFALTDDGLVYGWGTFRVSVFINRPQIKSSADTDIITGKRRNPRI